MYKYLYLCLLVFNYLLTSAQKKDCTHVLEIKTISTVTGMGISDVMVWIPSIQKGGYTDSTGKLLLDGLCIANYELHSRHLNHKETVENISIVAGYNSKTIYLDCHIDTLHQVLIQSSKIHWEDIAVKNVLENKALFDMQGNTLGKALEKINGVYNLSTGNNIQKPIVRGMHSNRILILNNGVRQEGQQWGVEHAPEIDPFIAKKIELIKGCQNIQYGHDVLGGVVLISPNDIHEVLKNNGEWNSSFMSNGRQFANSILWESCIGKQKNWTYRIQSTYKKSGNNKSPNYFLNNTGSNEFNSSIALGYHQKRWKTDFFYSNFNTRIGIFSGSHIGNLTDLYAAFVSEKPIDSSGFSYNIDFPFQKITHQLFKYQLVYNMYKKNYFQFQYAFQKNNRKEYDRYLGIGKENEEIKPALHFLLQTHSYEVNYSFQNHRRHTGIIGLQGLTQVNNYFGKYFIPNFQRQTGGIFVSQKWHKGRFSTENSVRYDINTFSIQKWENGNLIERSHAYKGAAFSSAMRYQMQKITTHFHFGTTWRAPHANELYSYGVHHSAAAFEIGDSTLQKERSYNTAMTVDIHVKKYFQAELTIYNHFIKNFIVLNPVLPATLTIRGAFPTFAFVQSNVNLFGLEFAANTEICNAIQLHSKFNVLYAKDITQNKYVFGMPPLRAENEIEIKILKKKQHSITSNTNIIYTAKQTRLEPNSDYIPAPNAYWLLHTYCTLEIQKNNNPIKIQVGANNLFNTRYRDFLNRNRYFADEIGRNIFVRTSIPLGIVHL